MERIKQFIQEEKSKLSGMSLKSGIVYILTYFWIPIAAVLFFLIFGIYLYIKITTNIPDNWLMVSFANTRADAGNDSELWKSFTEYAGYDLTQKKVVFDSASYFDYTKNQAKGNAYYNAFIALTDAGELDAITMAPLSLAALGQSGRLMDLNDERCSHLMAAYHDRLIYYQPAFDADAPPIPVGIDLSDSILATEYHMYEDGCGIGIGAKSENILQIEDFIEFVLQ